MPSTLYIAFLRGINIGGHRVKMDRLREIFAAPNVTNVRSFIQTGNIFFETYETDVAALTTEIEQRLATALGYEVPTFLRTCVEVEYMLKAAPFHDLKPTDDTRFLITFLKSELPEDFNLPIISAKNDYEILSSNGREVFSLLQITDKNPSNPAALIEKSCRMKTTSRFFATTTRILDAALNHQ